MALASKGSPVRLSRFSTLSLAVLLALLATACGKREIDPDKRAKIDENHEVKSGMSAARLKLKTAVQQQPRSGEARYDLGALLLAEGDPKAAVIELKRALELYHPDTITLPVLAEALVQSGQNKALVDGYAAARLGEPAAQAKLLAWVAQAQAAQGDSAGASATIEAALLANPKSAPALLMKARLAGMRRDIDGGIATLDQLLALEPKSDTAWVLKGELLQGRPDGAKLAMQAYETALQLQPAQVYALSAMIALHLSQRDVANAKTRLATLKKVAPNQANTVYVEAHVAFAQGEHARARELFQSLLRVLPENVNLLMSAGENELRMDSPVQAESFFAKASALAPGNALARRLLAQAQLKLGQAPKALVTLAPLVDLPQASAEALALAARARLLNGEAKAADELYARLAKMKPADPQLRTDIATANFGKQEDNAVISALRTISDEDQGISADMAIVSAHQRKGQYDQALLAVDTLARKRPNDPMVLQLRGQLLALKKDSTAARQAFDQALRITPTYFPSVAALAALDMQDKQPANARKRFNDLLKAEPKNAMALLALAEISARQGAPRADILRELNAAVKVAPAEVNIRMAIIAHHLNGGETEQALVAAQAAVAAHPDSFALLDQLAQCQIRAKQTNQALSTYGKIASMDPKLPHAYIGMVDAHLANNDLDAAQRAVNKLLEIAPDLPAGVGRAALIALRKNQLPAALTLARQLQAKPETAREGLTMEGQIEITRGNWDAAATALRKLVDSDSSTTSVLMLHTALTRGNKLPAAKALIDQWLKAHPQDAVALFYLGTQAEVDRNPAGAEQRYREILAFDPDHALALNNLAMLMVQQKRPGAIALAERAVDRAQEKATFLDTLAQAHAAEGQFAKAVEAQKRAVALAPAEHGWRLALAKLQLKAGDKAGAKAELDRLAALGASFAEHGEVANLRSSLTSLAAGR